MARFLFRLICLGIGFGIPAFADVAVAYADVAREFEYEQTETLVVEEQPFQLLFDGVGVYDVSYESPKEGRVPAYLVLPPGKGPFPAVVWGHWMDYKTSSRQEFLDEAIVLAHSGLASLMIDAPFVRPGFVPATETLSSQYPLAQQQMVMDVRRGIDYLLSRGEIDPDRLAYVGHSFDAGIGGILAGVEPRFKGLVIMAGRLNDSDYLTTNEPGVVEARKRIGEDKLAKLLNDYYWTNPYYHLREPGASRLLLQYGTHDWFVEEKVARSYVGFIRHPYDLRFYDANHELNAAARLDRGEWLKELLSLDHINHGALARVKTPD